VELQFPVETFCALFSLKNGGWEVEKYVQCACKVEIGQEGRVRPQGERRAVVKKESKKDEHEGEDGRMQRKRRWRGKRLSSSGCMRGNGSFGARGWRVFLSPLLLAFSHAFNFVWYSLNDAEYRADAAAWSLSASERNRSQTRGICNDISQMRHGHRMNTLYHYCPRSCRFEFVLVRRQGTSRGFSDA
jgi:hypothetical protein